MLLLVTVPAVVALVASWLPSALLFGISVVALGAAAAIALTTLTWMSSGPGYRALSEDHRWEFVHPDGSLVTHRKRMDVRFLHDVMAVTDVISGKDAQLSRYTCEPGRVVDRFGTGDQTWVLVSLGDVRHRGDRATLTFSRVLRDAFVGRDEFVDVSPTVRARALSLELVFPADRPPVEVLLVKRRRGGEHSQPLPLDEIAGRIVVRHTIGRPRNGTSYRIAWRWESVETFISHSPATRDLAAEVALRLRDKGLIVRTTDDDERERLEAMRDARAIVVILDEADTTDRQRGEWSAALDAAWERNARSVIVVLAGSIHAPPAALDGLPQIAVPAEGDARMAALDRLVQELWTPDRLERRKPWLPELPPVPALSAAVVDREDLEERRRRVDDAIACSEPGAPDPDTGQLVYDLGLALKRSGDIEGAQTMFERTIEIITAAVGPRDSTVLDATYNLGVVLQQRGNQREARERLQEAVRLGEASLGPDHPRVNVYRSTLEGLES
jgi:hypothetical protein